MKFFITLLLIFTTLLTLPGHAAQNSKHRLVVDVRHQELTVYVGEVAIRKYAISTSMFGIGDGRGTYTTPAGLFSIKEKIGTGLPQGTVFKSRRPTGEILAPNARGRDPVVTRILWLQGQEAQNSQAYNRFIYIHGTTQEKTIGRPASYGCIRMRSRDVTELYDIVGIGTTVEIKAEGAPRPTARISSPRQS
ncbi:MAG: L,D-transpeptidase [Chthoniobacterales bacterium]